MHELVKRKKHWAPACRVQGSSWGQLALMVGGAGLWRHQVETRSICWSHQIKSQVDTGYQDIHTQRNYSRRTTAQSTPSVAAGVVETAIPVPPCTATMSDVSSQTEQQPPRRSYMVPGDRRMPTMLINNKTILSGFLFNRNGTTLYQCILMVDLMVDSVRWRRLSWSDCRICSRWFLTFASRILSANKLWHYLARSRALAY